MLHGFYPEWPRGWTIRDKSRDAGQPQDEPKSVALREFNRLADSSKLFPPNT